MFNIILYFIWWKMLMSEIMDYFLLKIKMIFNVLFLLVEVCIFYYLSWLCCICKKFVFIDEVIWLKKV